MFFHGIKIENLLIQYPVLSPGLITSRENQKQLSDREHLIERYGFEPIHLLQSSRSFPVRECLKNCFNFGNIVLMFNYLNTPVLHLSKNEVGVPEIDVRKARILFINRPELINKSKRLFKGKPIYLIIDKLTCSKAVLIN